jgi:hypothetical protein
MERESRPPPSGAPGSRRLLTSVVLALTGLAAVVLAVGDREPPPPLVAAVEAHDGLPSGGTAGPVPPPSAPTSRAADQDVADRIRGPMLPAAAPVTLRIRGIGVATQLVSLGLDDGGALETPADPDQAGWYALAPPPGALGPAVIAGHVTWDREPAVFFRLGELRRGDRVEVLRADRRTAVFAVRRVLRFAKSSFPTAAVYGPTDHAALRLITCGGRYDPDRATYEDNMVVFADLVAVHGP